MQSNSGGLKVREAGLWHEGRRFEPQERQDNQGVGGDWATLSPPSTTYDVPLSKAQPPIAPLGGAARRLAVEDCGCIREFYYIVLYWLYWEAPKCEVV